ncbi:MAG TPA: hypothetical protein VGB30_10275 [bacterium]
MRIAQKCLFLTAIIFVAGPIAYMAYAQPGTETDPVVSVSYLSDSMSLSAIELEGGEDFPLIQGYPVILIGGSCRMNFSGDGMVVDTTSGEIHTGTFEMAPGHMYYPFQGSDVSAFKLIAYSITRVAVSGITGSMYTE